MRLHTLYRQFFSHFAVILLGILLGCNKNGAGCFDKAGNIKTVTIDLPAFTTIDVASNVQVQLLTKGSNIVEITTGENLISGIKLQVEDSVLLIENLNTCFWSRGYKQPLVSIRNADLEKIIQHGYGSIYTSDTLSINKIAIQVEDASGAVDLLLNTDFVQVVSNNIGPITLRGSATKLDVAHYWSDGILYASELKVTDCYINQNGSNRMEINVSNSLEGSINSIGNVYLFGQEPATVDVDLTNEGRIINRY